MFTVSCVLLNFKKLFIYLFLQDGKMLVHPLQVDYIHQVIQTRLVDHPTPLTEVYSCLHFFCQSLQLEVYQKLILLSIIFNNFENIFWN